MRNNYCFIVGNLGADPIERGRTEKSDSVVGFSVAENVQSFDSQTKTYKTLHTNWFNVTTFGTTAEKVLKSLHKGDRVAVQGKMKVSKYTTKTGEEKATFEIIADEVALWKGLQATQKEGSPVELQPEELQEDDLPF